MQKESKVVRKDNTSAKPNKINWDKVRETITLIRNARGEVVNRHKHPRTFKLPKRPGIKLLGYGDLLQRAGFARQYSQEEIEELDSLRTNYVDHRKSAI